MRTFFPLQTRRAGWFDTRPFIFAALAGAALEYFFDPEKGHRRRAVTREQLGSTVRHATWRLSRLTRYLSGEVYGGVEKRFHLHVPDNPDPDDNTLRDRVESELFRDRSVPKGHLNINVAKGVVELRGQVEIGPQIDAIVREVRDITGVREIHNYLHVRGTPPPNKADVLAIG